MPCNPRSVRICTLLAMVGVLAAVGPSVQAGNTGTTLLARPQGETSPSNQGDFISTSLTPSSERYYAYFIEVPPATPFLRVDLFDADVGSTSGGSFHDRTVNTFNTSCVYTLFDPAGDMAATATRNNTTALSNAANNAWQNLFNTADPDAGHWELRVDMGSGDDWNSFGVRAYDGVGNEGAAGVELNIYHHPFLNVGVNPTESATYTFYPYVTSHCSAQVHEFDYDDPGGGDMIPGSADDNGFIGLSSRAGNFTQIFLFLTNNDTWSPPTQHFVQGTPSWPGAAAVAQGFPAGSSADDYGIWTATVQIDDDVGNTANLGNYAQVFMTAGTAVPAAPTNQSVTGAYRIYLPQDGVDGNTPGGAPVKPYVSQFHNYTAGPNPPQVGVATLVTVTVQIENPTPFPITFSTPTNVVTANVPGGGATYAGLFSTSQGSVGTQPGIGGTGNIVWNPGTLASGATATLNYGVNATPSNSSHQVVVTGTPASNGTTAVFVDETGNTVQARATFTFGPLCELSLPQPGSDVLSIQLDSFDAYCGGAGEPVVISWSTLEEISNAGFNIYAAAVNSNRVIMPGDQLNEDMIPASGESSSTYVFIDERFVSRLDEARSYFLEDISLTGVRTLHGPFAMQFSTSGIAAWELY